MTANGLEELVFDDETRPGTSDDSVFREAFFSWLQIFQGRSINDQWDCLAPAGTDFQKRVWRALLDIPFGKKMSYKDIAVQIEQPGACRAVGSAIAANTIAVLIPCHRVIPASGGTGSYRWGSNRKLALIEAEQIDGSNLIQLFQ